LNLILLLIFLSLLLLFIPCAFLLFLRVSRSFGREADPRQRQGADDKR
jgi:hypothetical protein